MNKKLFLLLALPLFITSCGKSEVATPKSPFNDTYQRIGTTTEYDVTLSSLKPSEYNSLKEDLNKNEDIKEATRIEKTTEQRDLAYAYFGAGSSSNRCKKTTQNEVIQLYSNYVITDSIDSLTEEEFTYGIGKTTSTATSYTHDKDYKNITDDEDQYYGVSNKSKTNDEEEKTTWIIPYTTYTEEKSKASIFKLNVLDKIKSEFTSIEGQFKLLGENAIVGKNQNDYYIREAYSKFSDEQCSGTGKTYKAVSNYFYEGKLNKSNDGYYFTEFRFYTERLILSEPYDPSGAIAVLYLDTPVIIKFNETKYKIFYDNATRFNADVPIPAGEDN